MADASFVVDDPSRDDFSQPITVRTGAQPAPTPSPPLGQSNPTGTLAPGGASQQPAGISYEAFAGVKGGSPKANAPIAPTQNGQSAGGASQSAPAAPASPSAGGISYADFAGVPAPSAGPLTNDKDEGWLSGAAKGAATAAIINSNPLP
jgi:hypothetical protein